MYTSTTSKKPKPSTGFLARPKLGLLRSLYSSKPFITSPDKRKKIKKNYVPKMDFRKKPDYADNAYREAVSRLRILLAESYTPIKRPLRELDSAGEETDNQSLISTGSKASRLARYYYNPVFPRRHYYPSLRTNFNLNLQTSEAEKEPPKYEQASAPPELMSFIERQEEYIEQLEKESRFCRDELSSLLSKVKDVISENENLHERQKSKLIKSVFDHLETETETETESECKPVKTKTRIEGPAIVFESRISELEAQLTQARIDLRKAQEEVGRKDVDSPVLEGFKKQVEGLQREKDQLQETVYKLQRSLAQLKDKETDTVDKVKRSLDVAEQAQYEKNAAELEIRRLKDELDRQHSKLRDAISDQGRRIADERTAVERRYTQQIEQLTAELGVQWESTNKLQLELDKQRRENSDLRREIAQKQALIDELKKDMQNKIITLQSDIGVSGAEKSALEQQIATLNLANERSERQSKQEIARLQAEIQSLRQRLDRADADLIHSRRENIRLSEQVASLEKEINLNAALSEERNKTPREVIALPPPAQKDEKDVELSSMLQDMESKHAATVSELESMIHSQNQLMDKLSSECRALTEKLEDAGVRHKEEIRELQNNLDRLSNRFSQSQTQLGQKSSKDDDCTPVRSQRTAPSPQPAPDRILSRASSRNNISSSRHNSQDLSLSQDKLKQIPEPQYQEKFEQDQYGNHYGQDYSQFDPNQHYDQTQHYDQYDQQFDPSQQYDPSQYQQEPYDPMAYPEQYPDQPFTSEPQPQYSEFVEKSDPPEKDPKAQEPEKIEDK